MVDSISVDHWATAYICSKCGKTPENAPLYHCPYQHQYCNPCFKELRRKYRGLEVNGCFCKICQKPFIFKETKINSEFLRKLKSGPGIGRPFRYNTNQLLKNSNSDSSCSNKPEKKSLNRPDVVTVEKLFGLSKYELNKLFQKTNQTNQVGGDGIDIKSVSSKSNSRYETSESKSSCYCGSKYSSHKPILCPHSSCNRMIAISSFSNHFRYEHPELKKYSTERNKEILIPFDISTCETGKSFCLAILTLYESNNKIDLIKSKSTHSVIKTCTKFCQKVPLDTFWIMSSGSKSKKKSDLYILFWIFSNTNEKYFNTIELSSKNDKVSFSCYSEINKIPENLSVDEISKTFNCLYINHGSAVGLLKESTELNLRITVH